MRLVKVGNKNFTVTDAVAKTAAAWDCKPVEGEFCDELCKQFASDATDSGMLSCQQSQNVIDGKKRIILNPNEAQRRDIESITFAEDEVYGIDILISSGEDGKV